MKPFLVLQRHDTCGLPSPHFADVNAEAQRGCRWLPGQRQNSHAGLSASRTRALSRQACSSRGVSVWGDSGCVWSAHPGFWLQEPGLPPAPPSILPQPCLFPLSVGFGLCRALVPLGKLLYHQEPESFTCKMMGVVAAGGAVCRGGTLKLSGTSWTGAFPKHMARTCWPAAEASPAC